MRSRILTCRNMPILSVCKATESAQLGDAVHEYVDMRHAQSLEDMEVRRLEAFSSQTSACQRKGAEMVILLPWFALKATVVLSRFMLSSQPHALQNR